MSIAYGQVGWSNSDGSDDGSHYDAGSLDDDGHLLIKVQLHEGRDITKPLTPDKAQGHKILCHMSSHIYRIPPRGTRVLIAMPDGMEYSGVGVILATIEPQKLDDTAVKTKEDRVVIDYGPDVDVLIAGRSVTVRSYSNEFVSVGGPNADGTDGVAILTASGTGAVFQPGSVDIFTAEDTGDGAVGKSAFHMTYNDIKFGVQSFGSIELSTDGWFTWANSINLVSPAVVIGNFGVVPPTLADGCAIGTGGAFQSAQVFVAK